MAQTSFPAAVCSIAERSCQRSAHSFFCFTMFPSSSQHSSVYSSARLFHHPQGVSPSSSSIKHLRRPYESYDETAKISSLSSKCPSTGGTDSSVSSPYIRRTPFARRSLPHHIQPVLKTALKSTLPSSPDPFQTIKTNQQLRHVVLAEPSLPSVSVPIETSMERHFSDLSLNQIENDSLMPSASGMLVHHRPSLSYSSSSTASSSSTSSSTDESTTAFVHIHMNNARCSVSHRDQSMPFAFATTTINDTTSNSSQISATPKSSSFIQNVSITV